MTRPRFNIIAMTLLSSTALAPAAFADHAGVLDTYADIALAGSRTA